MTTEDYIREAATALDSQQLGEFVAVMWEVWNERNRYIFGQRQMGIRCTTAARAVQFVRTYRAFNEKGTRSSARTDTW